MQTVTPAVAAAALEAGTAVVVDVREPAELAQASVDGARHIPLGELVERLDDVPADRTVYVLCHSGGRSAQATQFLEQQGYDVANIEGGITAWYQGGLPVVLGGEH